jgi:hypothetical protein
MKKIFLGLALLALAGCASNVVGKNELKKSFDNSQSQINIYRPSGFSSALLAFVIQIDGETIAALNMKDATQRTITPGKHKLSTYISGSPFFKRDVTLDFQAGKAYYFSIEMPVKTGKDIEYQTSPVLNTLNETKWLEFISQ